MRQTEIDNSADILDSRDIIKRIKELNSEREDLQTAIDEAEEHWEAMRLLRSDAMDEPHLSEEAIEDCQNKLDDATEKRDAAQTALTDWDNSDEGTELKNLKDLAEQCEGYGDWRYGETLIHDSYFKEYAQNLADEIGTVDNECTWPNTCIDWNQAAEELQQDYTSVEFDGETYWMRS